MKKVSLSKASKSNFNRKREILGRKDASYRRLKPIAATVMCALATGATPVAAQELEEIIVTATRRAESAMDIPYNISVLSADELERRRAIGYSDLSRMVAGLAMIDQGAVVRNVNNSSVLRGINAQGTLNNQGFGQTGASAVSTYLDETPVFFSLTLKDMERIEVLRGPQGTLYGSGALGGTIRFIPKKPDLEKGLDWKIDTFVDFPEDSDEVGFGADIMVNLPVSDTFGVRVAGGYVEEGGFIDAIGRVQVDADRVPVPQIAGDLNSGLILDPAKDVNDTKSWWLRATALWQPTDEINVTFRYQHEDREQDDEQVVNPFAGGVLDNSVGDNPATPEVETFPGSFFANPLGCPDLAALGFVCGGPGGLTLFPNGGTTYPATNANENILGQSAPYETDIDLLSLDLNIDFGFATLTSATSYYELDDLDVHSQGGFFEKVAAPGSPGFMAYYGYYPRWTAVNTEFHEVDGFVEEVRLISNWDKRWDFVVGAFYQDVEHTFDFESISPGFFEFCGQAGITIPTAPGCLFVPGFQGFNPQLVDLVATLDRTLEFEDIALFGEFTFHITDKWDITGGVRGFWQQIDHTFLLTLPYLGPYGASDQTDLLGTTFIETSSDFADHILKFNTSYEITDNLMAYFTWAEGFRRGGANATPTAGVFASLPEFTTYDPDEVTNWEVGLKGRLWGKVEFTTAFYFIEWDRFQFEDVTPSSIPGVVFNGDEAESIGVEIQARSQLTDQLSLDIGYAFTDAQVTKDFAVLDLPIFALLTGQGPVPGVQTFEGDAMPGVPKHSVTLGADYEHPLPWSGWTAKFHVDGSFRDDTVSSFNDISNFGRSFFELDSFWIWNASLVLDSGSNWSASLFVRNIGNEEGITGGLAEGDLSERGARFYVAKPRTIGLGFSYSYY